MVSKKIITKIVLLILLMPRIVFSQNLNSIYFDPDYWKNFDWNNAEESLLWKDSSYVANDYHLPTFQKVSSQEIVIEGKTYLSIIKQLNKGSYPYEVTLILSKSIAEVGSCELLNKRLTQAYGISSDMTGYSYSPSKNIYTYKNYWQWDADNTRVTLECGDVTNREPNKDANVSVTYQHLDKSSKIENPIHLSCSYRSQAIYKGTPSAWEQSNQPLDISIFPHTKIITNGHRQVLVHNADVTDTSINYLFRTELLDIEYSINRMNGNLTATGINKKEADVKLRFEGMCQLRDPNKRMF